MLELQVSLLNRAQQIVGGRRDLREFLGVSDECLAFWLASRVRLPDALFLKIVDLVLRDDIARASDDRRHRPRVDGVASNDAGRGRLGREEG